MTKIREVRISLNNVPWYDIECECGHCFKTCVVFSLGEAKCPECERRYKITRIIAIELVGGRNEEDKY